jgi:hypothetical protein
MEGVMSDQNSSLLAQSGFTEGDLAWLVDKQNGAPKPFEIVPSGLKVNGDPTFDEWLKFGSVLNAIGRASAWAVGDWINYGEDKTEWGEKYSQALSSLNYEYGTLRNYSWVSRCFPPDKRHVDTLSVGHHMAVARKELTADERETYLQTAETKELSREDLRALIKGQLPGDHWTIFASGEYTLEEFTDTVIAKNLKLDKKYRFSVRELEATDDQANGNN